MPMKHRPDTRGARPKTPPEKHEFFTGDIDPSRITPTDTSGKRIRQEDSIGAAPVPVYPPPRTLLAERPFLRHTLRACGVAACDIDDVLAECLLGAWRSIQRGQFRVAPWADPDEALRRWLVGIAWRLASHERERAHHRREVLMPDPWALTPEAAVEATVDPEGQLLAREGLRALAGLSPSERALLFAAVYGSSSEIAALARVSRTSVEARLQAARALLAAALDGRPPMGASKKRRP